VSFPLCFPFLRLAFFVRVSRISSLFALCNFPLQSILGHLPIFPHSTPLAVGLFGPPPPFPFFVWIPTRWCGLCLQQVRFISALRAFSCFLDGSPFETPTARRRAVRFALLAPCPQTTCECPPPVLFPTFTPPLPRRPNNYGQASSPPRNAFFRTFPNAPASSFPETLRGPLPRQEAHTGIYPAEALCRCRRSKRHDAAFSFTSGEFFLTTIYLLLKK